MAEPTRQTVVSDILKAIHDAWEFFAPPFIRLGIVVFFFWYIAGSGPLLRVRHLIETEVSFLVTQDIAAVLAKYNLTALAPIGLLFLISIFAYTATRLVNGVSALLPFNISSTASDVIDEMVRYDPVIRKRLSPAYQGRAERWVNYLIVKARLEKKESFLSNVDYWQGEVGKFYRLFSLAKFLLAWAIACGVLSVVLADATPFTLGRISLLLILVILLGLFGGCKHAYAIQQLNYAKIEAVRVVLAAEASKPRSRHIEEAKQDTPEQEANIKIPDEIQVLRRRWWWIAMGLMDWARMLKYFRYRDGYFPYSRRNLVLQVVLNNSTNLLWFALGAALVYVLSKLSWWLGSTLFVGYVSVAIIESLLVGALAVATFGQALLVRVRERIPSELLDLIAENPLKTLTALEHEGYWLGVAAWRVLEVGFAIVLSRSLASFLF